MNAYIDVITGLNPCFSGTYSQRKKLDPDLRVFNRLNPCFSGTYSQSGRCDLKLVQHLVLILVLVEHTLRAELKQQNGAL